MNELKELLRVKMQYENYLSIHYKQNDYFEKLMYVNTYNNRINLTHYKQKDFYLLKIYDNENNLICKDIYTSLLGVIKAIRG